jgi:hypothetical protein
VKVQVIDRVAGEEVTVGNDLLVVSDKMLIVADRDNLNIASGDLEREGEIQLID